MREIKRAQPEDDGWEAAQAALAAAQNLPVGADHWKALANDGVASEKSHTNGLST
jgi:hypothetical protein